MPTTIVECPASDSSRRSALAAGFALALGVHPALAAERRRVVLIVTSGHFNGVQYQLGYSAVGAGGRLPGWIAF